MHSADVTATFCATLIDEWIALGVRHAVLAPGSRSTPMALALCDAERLSVAVFHDERSAAFAALGIGKASGTPCLLLCTSGTAAANFHPAVVEASHAEVPLIVLTADRPPELQGVGAPQTINQKHLYGSVVRTFLDAGVPDDGGRDEWRSVARRVVTASLRDRPGPVHLNLPFREPLVGSPDRLPQRPASSGKYLTGDSVKPIGTEMLSRLGSRMRGKRGVIVTGDGSASSPEVMRLARALAWPVLADPLSGCRGDSDQQIRHADAWLRDGELASHFTPEAILRFGTLPASKVVNGWLRDSKAEVTTVTRSSFLIDPERQTTMHVVTEPDQLCRDLVSIVSPTDPSWLDAWLKAEASARHVVASRLDDEPELSEPGVARCVVAAMPARSHVVVSSSMPIRDVEWYSGAGDHLRIIANRGANGIDGVVSTAVGVALATRQPTSLLIGDIAFLHDANGLIDIRRRGIDLRIVVIDNGGGGIFSFLPQRTTMEESRFEQLFGTPHGTDLAMIGRAHDIEVETVCSASLLRESIRQAGPRMIIVRTNRDQNVVRHDEIHREVIAAVSAATRQP